MYYYLSINCLHYPIQLTFRSVSLLHLLALSVAVVLVLVVLSVALLSLLSGATINQNCPSPFVALPPIHRPLICCRVALSVALLPAVPSTPIAVGILRLPHILSSLLRIIQPTQPSFYNIVYCGILSSRHVFLVCVNRITLVTNSEYIWLV